jgi:glycosyltransferase involved in cell wall biosynthesis
MKPALYIIGSNGIPARYGGFETFAEQISIKLAGNYHVVVVCSSYLYLPDERQSSWNNISRIFVGLRANGWFSLLYDLRSLWISSEKADYILMLGSGSAIFLPLFSARTRRKIIVHIDGLEWRRQKWNLFARITLRLGKWCSEIFARSILIDNKGLSSFISMKYQYKLGYITYGGEHLPQPEVSSFFRERPYALMIARAEPENNLHVVLETFENSNVMDLIIISNWQNSRYGRNLFVKYANKPYITLSEPIYDTSELQQYRRNCRIYIHGHSAGGTNPSLVEAMYTGVPIIAWDNEFNRITTNSLALYFKTKQELSLIISALNTETLKQTSGQMKLFAVENYTWTKVAEDLINILNAI